MCYALQVTKRYQHNTGYIKKKKKKLSSRGDIAQTAFWPTVFLQFAICKMLILLRSDVKVMIEEMQQALRLSADSFMYDNAQV